MAMEVAAITAGPVKNLTAMEKAATDFPHEMIFGWSAMKRPSFFVGQIVYERVSHGLCHHHLINLAVTGEDRERT